MCHGVKRNTKVEDMFSFSLKNVIKGCVSLICDQALAKYEEYF